MQTRMRKVFLLLEKHGQLMNKAFAGIGINRDDVYIANIVKCRPPQNRNPEKDEADACREYIDSQIQLVSPEVIVLLRKRGFEKYSWRKF